MAWRELVSPSAATTIKERPAATAFPGAVGGHSKFSKTPRKPLQFNAAALPGFPFQPFDFAGFLVAVNVFRRIRPAWPLKLDAHS